MALSSTNQPFLFKVRSQCGSESDAKALPAPMDDRVMDAKRLLPQQIGVG
jgi:hypothetical protein